MKIAVYTANFGRYDKMYNVIAPNSDGIDWVYFTDVRRRSNAGWDVRVVNRKFPNEPRRESRWFWHHALDLFPGYDVVIKHGAMCQLTIDPRKLLFPNQGIGTFRHPHRNCLYEEAKACMAMKKGNTAKIAQQVRRYRADGYPVSNGLYACMLFVKHNLPKVKKLEERWWAEIVKGSTREQIALPYLLWKMKMKIGIVPGDPFNCGVMRVHPHGKKT